jgi:uncharacterized membrane protein
MLKSGEYTQGNKMGKIEWVHNENTGEHCANIKGYYVALFDLTNEGDEPYWAIRVQGKQTHHRLSGLDVAKTKAIELVVQKMKDKRMHIESQIRLLEDEWVNLGDQIHELVRF